MFMALHGIGTEELWLRQGKTCVFCRLLESWFYCSNWIWCCYKRLFWLMQNQTLCRSKRKVLAIVRTTKVEIWFSDKPWRNGSTRLAITRVFAGWWKLAITTINFPTRRSAMIGSAVSALRKIPKNKRQRRMLGPPRRKAEAGKMLIKPLKFFRMMTLVRKASG
jgi:hypothetical protein